MFKVVEFKLDRLTSEQIVTLEEWLEVCRRTWNMGLALLIEHRDLTANAIVGEKDGKPIYGRVPRCLWSVRGETAPMPTRSSWHRNKTDGGDVWGQCSYILARHRAGGMQDGVRVGACCPIAIQDWHEPRLGMQTLGKFTLTGWFAQKRVRENYPYFAEQFEKVPVNYIRAVCGSLYKAWMEFLKGKRGEPRFKRPNQIGGSLRSEDAKAIRVNACGSKSVDGVCRDGEIRLPKLGTIPVKWLYLRWGEREISTLTIVKKTDAWYLQLGGDDGVQPPEEWKRNAQTKLTVYTDGDVLAADDRGVEYTPLPKDSKTGAIDKNGVIAKIDAQILALQQQISRQERHGYHSNRLKSNRQKLAKLHDRKTRILNNSRKKIAHFVAERSASVEIHTGAAGFIPEPEPNMRPGSIDPVHYDPNGAGRIADKNKERSRLASGEFVALIKSKAAERGYNPTIAKAEKPKKEKRQRKKKS